MVDRLMQHPYSDARFATVLAATLWTLGVALAAAAGVTRHIDPAPLAALLVFASGIAAAATTLDRQIGAWIASWRLVARVAQTTLSRGLGVLAAAIASVAVAEAAKALAFGAPEPRVSAALLAAVPLVAGLGAALAASWMRGGPGERRAPRATMLAATRISR